MQRVFENRPLGILGLALVCSAAAWGRTFWLASTATCWRNPACDG